ncbi:23234_t:CDS:2 [Gigaspora margarita]|uniref:23234_t:CDS:1 n=1 Tax=Gigaspora margarita TaxID=4874 RepID=A0ABN7V7V7_GIGMA|nr:23234_t:CDS:2 [Gigaspora margarita]
MHCEKNTLFNIIGLIDEYNPPRTNIANNYIQQVVVAGNKPAKSRYFPKKDNITEIVRCLIQKDNYILYGKWRHPQSYKNRYTGNTRISITKPCKKNYGEYIQITKESLRKYLNNAQDDFFTKRCDICEHVIRFKSFLIKFPNVPHKELEIICHLEWNNHYKVFGNWKCQLCRRMWKSALTWISLRKYIEQIPGKQLKKEDYYMQECNNCNGSRSIIINYEKLELSTSRGPHKSHLCAKCKSGSLCEFNYDDDLSD